MQSRSLENHSYAHESGKRFWHSMYSLNPSCNNYEIFKPIRRSIKVIDRLKVLRERVMGDIKKNSSALEALAETQEGETKIVNIVVIGNEDGIPIEVYKDLRGGYILKVPTYGSRNNSGYAKTRKDIIPELFNLIL